MTSRIYVQFTDNTETTIKSVFGSPQDPEEWPCQGEVEIDDSRYVRFHRDLPVSMKSWFPIEE